MPMSAANPSGGVPGRHPPARPYIRSRGQARPLISVYHRPATNPMTSGDYAINKPRSGAGGCRSKRRRVVTPHLRRTRLIGAIWPAAAPADERVHRNRDAAGDVREAIKNGGRDKVWKRCRLVEALCIVCGRRRLHFWSGTERQTAHKNSGG